MVGASEASPGRIYKDLPEDSGEGSEQREKEFEAEEEPSGGLKKRSGRKLEGKCGVRGWVLRRGSYISGASFCICGWGERSEPPAAYTKTCPRTPERGQSKGRKNLKQRRSPRGALKSVPGGEA